MEKIIFQTLEETRKPVHSTQTAGRNMSIIPIVDKNLSLSIKVNTN